MGIRIYLAGFDVFGSDAMFRAESLRTLCVELGLTAVFPAEMSLDPTGQISTELSGAIFQRDLTLMSECDIVAADLQPSGATAKLAGVTFELGFGYAHGKKLYGYGSSTATAQLSGKGGLPLNRLITVPATIVHGDIEQCVRRIHLDLASEIVAA